MSQISASKALTLFRSMCEIRAFELIASERYRNGELPGFIHLSLGQEACAAGACAALQSSDLITSTHRGHGHCLAKGADPRRMMAELFAKLDGYGKGRAGSMHIADVAAGVLGANGIVGQSIGLGVGAALSLQIRRQPNVVLAFFGEGASGAGIAHEAMNMAAIWKLPIIFFCEANRYAELSPLEVHVAGGRISARAAAYGFPGMTINGEDVIDVYQATSTAVVRARQGLGPTLIEAKTFRWQGHYEGDPQLYKTDEEKRNGRTFDPILRFRERLAEFEGLTTDLLTQTEEEVNQRMVGVAEWASNLDSPPPAAMLDDVFSE
jgi:acetoin:2,6-dichlorophenolindophenol oxidoreductase subunit alpha